MTKKPRKRIVIVMKIFLLALGIVCTPLMAQSAFPDFKENTCDKVLDYSFKAISLPFNCLNTALRSPVGKALRLGTGIGLIATGTVLTGLLARALYYECYKSNKPLTPEQKGSIATVSMFYLALAGACGLCGYTILPT